MPSGDDHITADFATLQGLAGDLEEILKTLNEQLELLYGRVEKVVLTWDGEARQTFVDQLDKWDRSAQDLEATQAWLHDIVVNGHVTYAAAHRAVLRGWGAA
ncbi:WXG100 family type VII secretion target [Streptomyces sp. MB09-01]|uniref:WXG100 family type VII secretion target n=1 Tax=Streptomyces sp. MB09-01 TaxID=3028666 RepID=UPI0029B49365|nr:WXG100 family type VII secretion target [Streptomyces sp. MB09-01]MDX3537450.1 WXG100 family type VII secretion target [Streptomyces sp. MB09-01]